MRIINGDLLDAKEQHIAHQCNCTSAGASGLAYAVFKRFPEANIYASRRDAENQDEPGTIVVKGRVINMLAQFHPGGPDFGKDSYEARLGWFQGCLDEIKKIDGLTSVAFPYMIGCGLAEGNWLDYERMLLDFSESVETVVYRLRAQQ